MWVEAHEPARLVDLFRPDFSGRMKKIFSRFDGHNDLFHCSVACTLPQTVDRAFNLPGTVQDRSQGIGDS